MVYHHGDELPIQIPPDDGVDAVDHHGMDGDESAIGGVPGHSANPDDILERKNFEPCPKTTREQFS